MVTAATSLVKKGWRLTSPTRALCAVLLVVACRDEVQPSEASYQAAREWRTARDAGWTISASSPATRRSAAPKCKDDTHYVIECSTPASRPDGIVREATSTSAWPKSRRPSIDRANRSAAGIARHDIPPMGRDRVRRWSRSSWLTADPARRGAPPARLRSVLACGRGRHLHGDRPEPGALAGYRISMSWSPTSAVRSPYGSSVGESWSPPGGRSACLDSRAAADRGAWSGVVGLLCPYHARTLGTKARETAISSNALCAPDLESHRRAVGVDLVDVQRESDELMGSVCRA